MDENTALRRLSAEGLSLNEVQAVIRRLHVESAERENEAQRACLENNPQERGTCWGLGVEENAQRRLKEAKELQGHYPGVRREAAEALGLRPNDWWNLVYNIATK